MEGVNNTQDYYQSIKNAADFVVKKFGTAEIAIVLGSGLNGFADELSNKQELPYHDIPFMPQTTVKGHAGKLVYGDINGKKVFCLAGRSHPYEGRFMYELTFQARMLAMAGVKPLIATNASGGAGEGMYPGCLMLIHDHINLYRRNPLADTVEHDGLSPRHPDFSEIYSPRVIQIAKDTAKRVGVKLFEGVYGATSGPTFETPTEVKSFVKLGATAFGMSTIPETMAAKALGLEVFAMSLVTNLAAGMADEILTHSAVTEVANEAGPNFVKFMKSLVTDIPTQEVHLLTPTEKSVITPLPKPQVPAATQAQVGEIVAKVSSALKLTSDTTHAVFLSAGHDAFVDNYLVDVSSINYKDIPNWPTHGTSRGGRFAAGTLKGSNQRVVVFTGNSLEGFVTEDATLAAEVLAKLGIRRLFQTFAVGTTGLTNYAVGDVVVLADCIDSTTVHPYPHSSSKQGQYLVDVTPFNKGLSEKANGKHRDGVYIHLPGPSFPTPAEVASAKFSGCNLIGINSLTPVYSAGLVGLEVVGIAEIASSNPTKPFDNFATNGQIFETLQQLLTESHKVTPTQQIVQFQEPASRQQATIYLSYPVNQGSYEDVTEATAFLQSSLKEVSVKTAVVLDSSIPYSVIQDKIDVSYEIPYEKIPHMKLQGKFVFGKFKENSQNVIVLSGTGYLNEGRPARDVTFGIRILGHLKVTNILFVAPFCSIDSSIQVGDLVVPKDHIMLAGRNPLFGINEERWGTRFPDASEAYNKKIERAIEESGKELSLALHPVLFANIVGPIVGSFADAHYAHAVGMQALSTGVAPEVLVARHMSQFAGAIGVVTNGIYENTKEIKKGGDDVVAKLSQKLADLVVKTVARVNSL